MDEITTGPIDHDQFCDEIRFIQDILLEAGVRTVSVCCAFGVYVDHPLFAKEVDIEAQRLADYLIDLERAGILRLGLTNITLTTDLEGLEFFLGNDDDVFCKGEQSQQLFRLVSQRWASRYPIDR